MFSIPPIGENPKPVGYLPISRRIRKEVLTNTTIKFVFNRSGRRRYDNVLRIARKDLN